MGTDGFMLNRLRKSMPGEYESKKLKTASAIARTK
jgi:hypothetical protein